MFCTNCGARVSDSAAFCGGCGKPVGNQGAPTEPSATQAERPFQVPVAPKRYGKLIGAAVFAVALIAVAVIVIGGRGGGHATADQVAGELSHSMEEALLSGLDESSVVRATTNMLGLMPPGALEAALNRSKYGSKEELLKEMQGSLGIASSSMSSLSEYLSKMRVAVNFTPSEDLTDSELSDMNESIRDLGLDYVATKGKDLSMEISVTALEDMPGVSKGETKTQTSDSLGGLCVIEVNGSWYLWCNIAS